MHCTLEVTKEIFRGLGISRILVVNEFPWNAKTGAIHRFLRGGSRFFTPGNADTGQYQREVIHPIRVCSPSFKGALELTV